LILIPLKVSRIIKFYLCLCNGEHHSTDYKLSVVTYYLSMTKPSTRKACKIFGCSIISLSRWVTRYLQTGSVKNKPRKEGSYKIRKIHVKFILDLIKNKSDIFLWQILGEFHKKLT
jgi:transposase